MKALLEILSPEDPDWPLVQQLRPDRLPAHIAIIMDGNGRWARKRRLPRVAGHHAGVESVRASVETCARLEISALTLYAFSSENWKRPRLEVETLWQLLIHSLRKELKTLEQNNIRLLAAGRLGGLPAGARNELESAMRRTECNTGMRLNLAINYGGRAEIVDAVNALIEEARAQDRLDALAVTEEALARHLYTASLPDPDLLIRTSGEMRISNFLLWQIAYSELYVTGTLWPDFRRRDLLQAVLDYQRRDRRFGGLSTDGEVLPVTEPVVEEIGAPTR